MNNTTIAGHLGADPEVRFTSSGQKVTTLRVAARVRRSKDKTIWWKVTVWGELFDKMIPHFKKGSPIIVTGDLNEPEIFTDREGRPKISMSLTATDILFSPFGRPDGRSESAGEHAATESAAKEPAFAAPGESLAYGQGKGGSSFEDDEIPF
jgi:single-strand DNA-binding protein